MLANLIGMDNRAQTEAHHRMDGRRDREQALRERHAASAAEFAEDSAAIWQAEVYGWPHPPTTGTSSETMKSDRSASTCSLVPAGTADRNHRRWTKPVRSRDVAGNLRHSLPAPRCWSYAAGSAFSCGV
ncbi:hypothetical protein [Nocardia sp. NPDC057353]|uniref:hypothetical protein n=1 Tax=Nocardia sp. NPDC057353 TaxID=3346104 RepID=UPI0036289DC9